MKICTGCDTEKPISEFHKDKTGKFGVRSRCKACEREYTSTRGERFRRDNESNCSPTYTMLSLGAGIQSSTMFLMACKGIIHADGAVFADTLYEPHATYDYLDFLKAEGERSGIALYICSGGDMIEDDIVHMPLFFRKKTGGAGMVKRQCTTNYKIRPVRSKMREVIPNTEHVDMQIGISTDESTRMKPSGVRWIHNKYPLIELGMGRSDCVEWLQDNNYSIPPKSACVFCPYRSIGSWAGLSEQDFERACAIDEQVRNKSSYGELFVHRSLKPLRQLDRTAVEPDLFDNECSGMCGL